MAKWDENNREYIRYNFIQKKKSNDSKAGYMVHISRVHVVKMQQLEGYHMDLYGVDIFLEQEAEGLKGTEGAYPRGDI